MSRLSIQVRDKGLESFAGKTLDVGLFDGELEISDPLYQRQPAEFSEPRTVDDVRFVENLTELRFRDMGKDHRVDGFGLFDEGARLATFKLLRPLKSLLVDDGLFRPGSLRVAVV